jgi:hypothetical protein
MKDRDGLSVLAVDAGGNYCFAWLAGDVFTLRCEQCEKGIEMAHQRSPDAYPNMYTGPYEEIRAFFVEHVGHPLKIQMSPATGIPDGFQAVKLEDLPDGAKWVGIGRD